MGPSGTERNALSILIHGPLVRTPAMLIYGTLTHQSWRNEGKEIEQVHEAANETNKTNTSNIGKGDPMRLNAYDGLHAHSLEQTRRRTKRDHNKYKESAEESCPKLKSQQKQISLSQGRPAEIRGERSSEQRGTKRSEERRRQES